jgi:hypothetical protein
MAEPAPETRPTVITRVADVEPTLNAEDIAELTWHFQPDASWVTSVPRAIFLCIRHPPTGTHRPIRSLLDVGVGAVRRDRTHRGDPGRLDGEPTAYR